MGLLQNLTGWHALILLAVVLLFFGASKLPALAKSVGQSARILKTEARDGAETREGPASADPTAPVAGTVDAPAPADRL
jgi:sec-independent protein translocase protein TatA